MDPRDSQAMDFVYSSSIIRQDYRRRKGHASDVRVFHTTALHYIPVTPYIFWSQAIGDKCMVSFFQRSTPSIASDKSSALAPTSAEGLVNHDTIRLTYTMSRSKRLCRDPPRTDQYMCILHTAHPKSKTSSKTKTHPRVEDRRSETTSCVRNKILYLL